MKKIFAVVAGALFALVVPLSAAASAAADREAGSIWDSPAVSAPSATDGSIWD